MIKKKSSKELSDLELFTWITEETGWLVGMITHKESDSYEYFLSNTKKTGHEG